MRAVTAYRAFHATHAPHGPLVFGADEPTTTGYRVLAACPCGAAWEWWVSLAEVLGDLEAGYLRRLLAETEPVGAAPSRDPWSSGPISRSASSLGTTTRRLNHSLNPRYCADGFRAGGRVSCAW